MTAQAEGSNGNPGIIKVKEATAFEPFICITINGSVAKLPIPTNRVHTTSIPEDRISSLNIYGGEDKPKSCFSVCITLNIPFVCETDDREWGVTARFFTNQQDADPEYVIGVLSSNMTHPKVFTQNVPVSHTQITGIEFKAMPQETKRKEVRDELLKCLDEAMAEKAKEEYEKDKANNDDKVIKVPACDLRVMMEKRMQNRCLSNDVWREFLKHQNKFTVETDAKKELLVSEMFSKKKDPCYWTETPVDYERIVIDKAHELLKKNGRTELPLLMELLWTDRDPLLEQATRRVLCPNWKVLKEILYDNKNKFEWKTNHAPPYISLKAQR